MSAARRSARGILASVAPPAWLRSITAAIALAGCGTPIQTDPLRGDIEFQHEGYVEVPMFGVAVAAHDTTLPRKMLVQIGTGYLDCDTYIPESISLLPAGWYIHAVALLAEPSTVDVTLHEQTAEGTGVDQVFPMGLTVDAVDMRVRGHATLDTLRIRISGSFDIFRCF